MPLISQVSVAVVPAALIAAYATAQASNIEEVRVTGRNSTISYTQTLGDFCRANSSNPKYADLCVYVSTGTGVAGPGEQNYAGNPDCGNRRSRGGCGLRLVSVARRATTDRNQPAASS